MALDRDAIGDVLCQRDAELAARGARADLFLVGGAAVALAYDARRAPRDLDSAFQPTEVVRRAAAVIAERHNLTDDWLSDAVKGFLPGPDPAAQRYSEGDALNVDVAPARHWLAMKLFASRVETDAEDIAFFYRQAGFTIVEEGLDLVETAHRGSPVPAKVAFLLEEIVASLTPEDT